MIATENLIIPEKTVRQIIKRFAYELYENNFSEKELILVGVRDKGFEMASLIKEQLDEIAGKMKITLVGLQINKDNPLDSEISLEVDLKYLKGKSVAVVDDVLNSGRTMLHCLKILMEEDIKRIETVVLVNRSHKRFPVSANYKGYELSTAIDEHVEVRLEENIGVYLF